MVLRPVSPPRLPLWSEPMLGPPVPQDTGKKCLVSGGWRGGAERGRAWPLRCPSSTTPRSSHHTPTTTLNTPPQVLDLDETLVHSSFKPVPGADYVIPVEIGARARVLLARAAGSAACCWLGARRAPPPAHLSPPPSHPACLPPRAEGRIVDVYVVKRPFVDHFMRAVGQRFEVSAVCLVGVCVCVEGGGVVPRARDALPPWCAHSPSIAAHR